MDRRNWLVTAVGLGTGGAALAQTGDAGGDAVELATLEWPLYDMAMECVHEADGAIPGAPEIRCAIALILAALRKHLEEGTPGLDWTPVGSPDRPALARETAGVLVSTIAGREAELRESLGCFLRALSDADRLAAAVLLLLGLAEAPPEAGAAFTLETMGMAFGETDWQPRFIKMWPLSVFFG